MKPSPTSTKHSSTKRRTRRTNDNIGLGPDGLTHDDPFCAAIAPQGSPESRHGDLCGLCERRRTVNVSRYGPENLTQCGHHYGSPVFCRLIQVRTHPRDEWQPPFWCCRDCRSHLRGYFRYAVKENKS